MLRARLLPFMIVLRPVTVVLALALLASLANPTRAARVHGGQYRAPGAVPGPSAGPLPGGGVPGPAVAATGAGAPGTGGASGDLTDWSVWWVNNQAPYLALKERIRAQSTLTGSDGFFLGLGQKHQEVGLGPTVDQVRDQIVPALFAVLERETDKDLVSGALVALAKIGDDGTAVDAGRFEAAFARLLPSPSQELRETAALALGILASPRVMPTLAHLLWDTPEAQKRVRAREVDYRTRSFAAYGLGLVGARTTSELERQQIVAILRRAIEEDDTRSRDLEVACLIAIGLVPLATIDSPLATVPVDEQPPESGRLAQLEFLLAILRDERRETLARAQCPVTLVRLLAGLPEPYHARYRAEIAAELFERIEDDRQDVVQSCIVALGQLGTNDGKDMLDGRIRRVLVNVPRTLSDPQARAFAMIATASVGARYGVEQTGTGIDEAKEFLVDQLAWGKNAVQPWAALGCGVLAWRIRDVGGAHPALESLERALRAGLDDEGSPEKLGAYALGAGLARSEASVPRLMRLLEKELQDDARGQVALALGLLQHGEASELLRTIVARSKYRPALLRDCSIALGLLGDKDVGTQLVRQLEEARSLAAQSAIVSALGFIGDRRSVEPLLALLGNRLANEKARAFAAVALGNVADKELLPWNSKIGVDLNYRAAPATLSDPLTGTGILDIF
jgi:HEAT repeat protein